MNKKHLLKSDISVMASIFLIAVMAVGMMLTGHILLNMAYLCVTLLLILMTYFFGLVVGLAANMVFIFAQAFYMIYLLIGHQPLPVVLGFWLFLPVLLCLAVDAVTKQLRQIQQDNADLQEAMVEHGAFDQETKLRTAVSFLEDAAVYTETGNRFDIPVSTVTIKIRYYQDLKQMMGAQRIRDLINLVSTTIKDATRDNDVTYLLNAEDPTWAVLLFTDQPGAQIAAGRIRQFFDDRLLQSEDLAGVDLRLIISVVQWDKEAMATPSDFMAAGIKELEYDV